MSQDMATVLVATQDGLHVCDLRSPGVTTVELRGVDVAALVPDTAGGWWAASTAGELWRRTGGEWQAIATVPDEPPTCLLALSDEELIVGTEGAHLLRLDGDHVVRVEPFDTAEGRDHWHTPWGGPPATRSLAISEAGTLLVNVHVGGIARSDDGGLTFTPTIPIETDVHEVITVPGKPGLALAATAVGLAVSDDDGRTWAIEAEGLRARYLRAVAVAGETVVVAASTGPGGRASTLYRRPLDGGRFERCHQGLPDYFGDNVDTGWLAGVGEVFVCVGPKGDVFLSSDAGSSWTPIAGSLPSPRAVAVG